MNKSTTIFYVNSMGLMCQWTGVVIAKDADSITIRFPKKGAFKYNLKDLDIDFVLVTKKFIKNIGVCVSAAGTSISFDDNVKAFVKSQTANNVSMIWENKKWAA